MTRKLQQAFVMIEYLSLTYNDEVVPNSEELPHVDCTWLVLHRLREERDEVGRAEVRAVDGFFLQVAVQIGQYHGNQTVEPVEIQLQHRQLRVEQRTELENVDDLAHDCKGETLVLEEQEKETSDEVHALAVVELWVHDGVRVEYLSQVVVVDTLGEAERALDVLLDLILNLLRQVQLRLLLVGLELAGDELRFYFQDLEPEHFPLPVNFVLIGSQQGLLVDLVTEDIVEVFGDAEDVQKCQVAVDVFDGAAHDQGLIRVAELTESIRSFLERHDQLLVLGEHFSRVLLVRFELSEQDVRLCFVHLEHIAAPHQDFVGLLVRQRQVDEVVHEATQLVEYQVCILLQLKLKLLLSRLDEPF